MVVVPGLVVVLEQVRVMSEVKLVQAPEEGVMVPPHHNMEVLGLVLDPALGLALVQQMGVMGIWYLGGPLVRVEVVAVVVVDKLEVATTLVVTVPVVVLDLASVRQH
jgi:hypothetical protein